MAVSFVQFLEFLDKSGFAIMVYLRSRVLNLSYGKVRKKGTTVAQFNSGLSAFGLLPRGLDFTPVDHQSVLTPFFHRPNSIFQVTFHGLACMEIYVYE